MRHRQLFGNKPARLWCVLLLMVFSLGAMAEIARAQTPPLPRTRPGTPPGAGRPERRLPKRPPTRPGQPQSQPQSKPQQPQSQPQAQPQAQPQTKQVTTPVNKKGGIEMNFKNVGMLNFLQLMSKGLEIPMLWDETKIKGSITLVSPETFNKSDAMRIFETVLRMHGYTTIREEGSPLVQVVPITDAPRLPSVTLSGDDKNQRNNFFVTQIIPLKYADANQIRAALTPLISKTAGLAIYAPGNVLILSDSEANVQRLLSIIKTMDVPDSDVSYEIVELQNASAKKLAPLLTTLINALPASEGGNAPPGGAPAPSRPTPRRPNASASGGGGGGIQVVADERINAIILVGPPALLEKFREIIARLDVAGTVEEIGMRVVNLAYGNAEDLVKILKEVDVKAEQVQDAQTARRPTAPRKGTSATVEKVTLSADKATNAIIMFGPVEVMEILSEMISRLDVPRPQVFVEVLIMEMTLEKSLQLGVQWQGTQAVTNGVAGAGFPDAVPRTLENTLLSGAGASIGVVGNEITFAGQKFVSFSGFIRAAQQDSELNVLATPQLLTLNNEEAEINVSQVVPVSTKTVTNTNQQSTTQFEFKDVGIILKITPQITGEDKVRLAISQESSSIASRQALNNASQQAVTTLQRKINTNVIVENDTTMVIGGLIQDQMVDSETKIPCLGDIPLLGFFFKTSIEEMRKINLLVFIRPKILRTREDMEATTRRAEDRFNRVSDPEENARKIMREVFGLKEPKTDDEKEEEAQEDTQKTEAGTGN